MYILREIVNNKIHREYKGIRSMKKIHEKMKMLTDETHGVFKFKVYKKTKGQEEFVTGLFHMK